MGTKVRLLSISDIHGNKAWMQWAAAQAPAYDALLLPGDLCDGMSPFIQRDRDEWEVFFAELAESVKPVIFCTGNHDDGLIPHLLPMKPCWPLLRWDREVLEVKGIRIRSLPYMCPLDGSADDTVWIYHEPPDGTPISKNKESREHFGCGSLQAAAMFAAESLPPLVIGGHQHTPGAWHWSNGRTLFLNSGQDLKAPVPHHLVIEISPRQISVLRNGRGNALTHPFNTTGSA